MALTDRQVEALDGMMQSMIEQECAKAQRELIERMIAESESGNGWTGLYMVSKYKEASTPWGIGDWVPDISLRDWLRSFLTKEDTDDDK